MRESTKFYIGGRWVEPAQGARKHSVVNPATEQIAGTIAMGTIADVNAAVDAARVAFASWGRSSRAERLDLLKAILAEYTKRAGDLADAITEEMGAPQTLARSIQVPIGAGHVATAARILENFCFEEDRGTTRILKEPIGVCGFITPWNWPLNQIACKVAPAIATGCTMVLKPSEVSPFSAQIFAEILDVAGVPGGVFNLVYGDGPTVGASIAGHPDIDMVSITGSTRAGVEVAIAAAPTVKRVAQELGGKSPNIILDDEAFAGSVRGGVVGLMRNSGQSCNAPARMLVPANRMAEAEAIALEVAAELQVGDPNGSYDIGPVSNGVQFEKIQQLIEVGIREGATLVAGGCGRPAGLERGFYVRPTIFSNVTSDMTIAREEIFGPVLVILPYDTIEQAIEIGNASEYGLAAYVSGTNLDQLRNIAKQLRAGQVIINGRGGDLMAPFGGYKKSGNGREWGDYGFNEFLEVKAVLGYAVPA